MTLCYRRRGPLATNAAGSDLVRRGERRDVPSYVADRIDRVHGLGRWLFADLAICLTAIVLMLAVLHVGE